MTEELYKLSSLSPKNSGSSYPKSSMQLKSPDLLPTNNDKLLDPLAKLLFAKDSSF